ncbi:MAG: NAD(P)H-dependent glycerol-3-phosphate dehydrogenase, partial [Chromatiales bacterium]
GLEVRLWGLEEEIKRLAEDRENRQFLPGIPFPDKLTPDANLSRVVECDEILVVVPSQAFHEVLLKIAAIRPLQSLCWATKGLDPNTRHPLSTDAETIFPGADLAVISGPTFAVEVAEGLPTAVTAASSSQSYSERLAGVLKGETFRAYTSPDIIGVQVGGAVKNVMAIAAGISDGLGFGANARAALITRGLAEITRLGVALGAHPETFMGLAGLGDLTLTCTDNKSRNRRMGLALAEGLTIEEARARIQQEVEGVHAAKETFFLASELNVEMPITTEVYRILYEGLDPHIAVRELLHRRQRAE